MKKMKVLAFAIIASFALVACNSTDSLLKKYEKAVEENDIEAAQKYAEKLSDKDDMTDEQKERFLKASLELMSKNPDMMR